MQNKHQYLSILLLASLIAIGATGCSRQARKNRCLQRANRYFQAGDYEKAQIEYMNVVRFDAHDTVAVTRLGLISYEQGRLAAAYAMLRKAEQLQPDNLDVRLKLGMTYFNLTGLKEARQEAIYILQKQPTNDEALSLLVETSAASADLNDTQQRLDKLAPQLGRRAGFLLALGFLHLRQQDLSLSGISREA